LLPTAVHSPRREPQLLDAAVDDPDEPDPDELLEVSPPLEPPAEAPALEELLPVELELDDESSLPLPDDAELPDSSLLDPLDDWLDDWARLSVR